MNVNLKRLTVGAIAVVAISGQPNGLFLVIPGYALLATVAVVPFLCYAGVRRLSQRGFSVPKVNLLWPAGLFLFWAGVSILYAPDPAYGLRVWSSMLFKFALFLALVSTVETARDLKLMFALLGWAGTAFAVQALLLFVAILGFGLPPIGVVGETGITDTLTYDFRINTYGSLGFAMSYINLAGATAPRVQAMFIEPGWFANFLELSLFATWGYRQLLAPRRRWLGTGMLLVQGVALLLTVSFAGWLAASCGLVALLAVRFLRRPVRFGWRLVQFSLVVVLLVTAVAIALPEFSGAIAAQLATKLNPSLQVTESSASQRIGDIQAVTRFFWERPIAGWGINQVKVINQGRGANNTFVTVAAELGIVGLVFYSWMLLAILVTVLANIRLAYRSRAQVVVDVTATTTGAMTALFIHALAVESSWTFFYWIGLTLVYLTNLFARRTLRTNHESVQEPVAARQLVPQPSRT